MYIYVYELSTGQSLINIYHSLILLTENASLPDDTYIL